MEEKNNRNLFRAMCILASVVAMLPVGCNYIMAGGIITEWIGRVEEISMGFEFGHFFLFPSNEILVNMGVTQNVLNSNMWFILSGAFYKMSGNMVLTYRIFMMLLQIGTAWSVWMLMTDIFGKDAKLPILFGVLLYMTCPYRLYVCYDIANLSQAVVWMLLPLYIRYVYRILRGKKGLGEVALGAIVLSGICYADVVLWSIITGITLLFALINRNVKMCISLVFSVIVGTPVLYRLVQCLFMNSFAELQIPLQSIMSEGYRLGEFFTAYAWREERPGMGLGLLLCLAVGIWLHFVEGEKEQRTINKVCVLLAVCLAIMSTCYFPWDIVQRIGIWALQFISIMDTPALFAGLAYCSLIIPAAGYVDRISRHSNQVIAVMMPIVILLFCIGGCVYQCNTLTYERLPIAFI